jgi:hypothetical protein
VNAPPQRRTTCIQSKAPRAARKRGRARRDTNARSDPRVPTRPAPGKHSRAEKRSMTRRVIRGWRGGSRSLEMPASARVCSGVTVCSSFLSPDSGIRGRRPMRPPGYRSGDRSNHRGRLRRAISFWPSFPPGWWSAPRRVRARAGHFLPPPLTDSFLQALSPVALRAQLLL